MSRPFPESVRVVRANLLFVEKMGCRRRCSIVSAGLRPFRIRSFYKARAMVLSGRTEHVDRLCIRLRQHCDRVYFLKGGIAGTQRTRLMQEIAMEDRPRIIIATGSYIGEGFDDPVSTRCSSQCLFRGTAHCSSMWGGYTVCTTKRKSWKSMTTSMRRYRCLRACSRNVCVVTRHSAIRFRSE